MKKFKDEYPLEGEEIEYVRASTGKSYQGKREDYHIRLPDGMRIKFHQLDTWQYPGPDHFDGEESEGFVKTKDEPKSPAIEELVDKINSRLPESRAHRIIKDNPKDVIGSKKLPFSALPWAVLAEAAAGMGEGAIKYGKHNYEAVGIRNSIYFDATLRHLVAWFLGEDIDPDSGIHHVTKAISSLMVLRDAQMYGKCTDDRPMPPPADQLAAAKELFASLTEGLKDCGKHYDRESIKRREEGE